MPGMFLFDDLYSMAEGVPEEKLAERRGRAGHARRHQHAVHLRHDGLPEGRDADALQHRQRRQNDRRLHEADGAGPPVHTRAAVPLLRLRARRDGLRHARLHDGHGALLPARGRDAGGADGAVHCAARRPYDVHRDTRPPGLQEIRLFNAAHGHHGRLALPDRRDEAGRGRDEHVRRSRSPTARRSPRPSSRRRAPTTRWRSGSPRSARSCRTWRSRSCTRKPGRTFHRIRRARSSRADSW